MTVSRRSFLTGAASTAAVAATKVVGVLAGDWRGWTDRSFLAANPQVAERTFAYTRSRLSIAEFAEMVKTGQTTLDEAREEWPDLVLAPPVEPEGDQATVVDQPFTAEDVERARAWGAAIV